METKQERLPANDHWRANGRAQTGLDLKLVKRYEKETRFEGCELKKERETRGRKTSREDVVDMKHSQGRVEARNKTG